MGSENSNWDEWALVTWGCPPNWEGLARLKSHSAKLNLTPWELAIFDAIWYGHGQVIFRELLDSRAFGTASERFPEKAKAAIERCFDENWIQFLTRDFLQNMQDELETAGYLVLSGIVGSGFENEVETAVGLISYTRRGASLSMEWLNDPPQPREHWTFGEDANGEFVCGTSIEHCRWALWTGPASPEDLIANEPPVKIGRWCDRWWDRFESGYKLRFTRQSR